MDYYNIIFYQAYKKSLTKQQKNWYAISIILLYLISSGLLISFMFTMKIIFLVFSGVSFFITMIIFVYFIIKNLRNAKENEKQTILNKEKEIKKFKRKLRSKRIDDNQVRKMIEVTKYRIELKQARQEKLNNISTTIIILTGLTFLIQLFLEIVKLNISKKQKLVDIFINFNSGSKSKQVKEVNEVYSSLNSEVIMYMIVILFVIVVSYFIFKSVAASIVESSPFISYDEKLLEKLNGIYIMENNNAPS